MNAARNVISSLGFVILAGLAASACGDLPSTAVPGGSSGGGTSQCSAGQAQLGIFDGAIQSICGCAEGSGRFVASHSGSLTCTVAAGTTVYFHYLSTVYRHEVISTGTAASSSFASSPVSDPVKGPLQVKVHAFQFTQAGTYPFQDAFDGGVQGQIIVQ